MKDTMKLGPINSDVADLVIRHAIRRAADMIHKERDRVEEVLGQKHQDTNEMVWESAYGNVLEEYRQFFNTYLPQCEMLQDEDERPLAQDDGHRRALLVDAIEGKDTFLRKQSRGISTSIALVSELEIAAAYVADVSAGEVYGFRPGSKKVYMSTASDTMTLMSRTSTAKLIAPRIVLCNTLNKYSGVGRALIENNFADYEVTETSKGSLFARLWKNEVAALLIPGNCTPHCNTLAVATISEMLGFRFYRFMVGLDGAAWVSFYPTAITTSLWIRNDTVVVHKNDYKQLLKY